MVSWSRLVLLTRDTTTGNCRWATMAKCTVESGAGREVHHAQRVCILFNPSRSVCVFRRPTARDLSRCRNWQCESVVVGLDRTSNTASLLPGVEGRGRQKRCQRLSMNPLGGRPWWQATTRRDEAMLTAVATSRTHRIRAEMARMLVMLIGDRELRPPFVYYLVSPLVRALQSPSPHPPRPIRGP